MKRVFGVVLAASMLMAGAAQAAGHTCRGMAHGKDDAYVSVWLDYDDAGRPTRTRANWSISSVPTTRIRMGLLVGFGEATAFGIGKPDQVLVPAMTRADPGETGVTAVAASPDGRVWTTTMRLEAIDNTDPPGLTSMASGDLSNARAGGVTLLDAIVSLASLKLTLRGASGQVFGETALRLDIAERDRLFQEAWVQASEKALKPLDCQSKGGRR